MPYSDNPIPDPSVNRLFRDLDKVTAEGLRMAHLRYSPEAPGATVQPVTLSMQEYLDIKTLILELQEIEEGLRHRESGNTLIDGRALENVLSLARKLVLP